MLSSSGTWCGSFWTSGPIEWARPPNLQWRIAFLRRLGSAVVPPRERCHLQSGDRAAAAGVPCGRTLDLKGDHPLVCKTKAGRLRLHHSVAQGLALELRRHGGAQAALEKRVPELHKVGADGTVKEAILDVVVRWPAAVREFWIDVHVRSPFGHAGAQRHPGAAADAGDRRKEVRYGDYVLGFGVETGGRLSKMAVATCIGLATTACQYGWRPGRGPCSLTARRLGQRASTLAELGAADVVREAITGTAA